MSDPLCRDCNDLGRSVKATRFAGMTPVCDAHILQRLGSPALGSAAARIAREMKSQAPLEPQEEKPMIDDATKAAIRKDYATGMKKGEIAAKHAVSGPTVKKIVEAQGNFVGASARSTKPKAGRAKAAPAGVATLRATPQLVDGIWASLSLEKKAELLNRLSEAS